ncbi:TPA: hypothetical protein H1005_00225 [archaeon]|uniref:Uncharacterized protein n=1 Tax=Candidatus Naiadarchaeum limnaeum TaxID=2756139 RepID=A0A832XLZ0_9ARCH|nr:hypothetical protein [Candidatus Naiadarchaeales archaeon SRR2090153.bin1042]HIK00518.1 hypothetical protein [Candidatus Naiadarchaeum limnaeum]
MAFQPAFSSSDYRTCINGLADLSNRFLEASRNFNLRFVTAPQVPRLTRVVQSIKDSNLQQVKGLSSLLTNLDSELDTLVKKFQLVQRSHQFDPTLKNFLGDFSRDSADAFRKLSDFVDESIKLADSVITVYAQIERDKKPAKTWIGTILAPETTSTKAMMAKANEAQKVLAEAESVCKDVRNMCQQTRNELESIKSLAIRNLIRRTPYSYSEI